MLDQPLFLTSLLLFFPHTTPWSCNSLYYFSAPCSHVDSHLKRCNPIFHDKMGTCNALVCVAYMICHIIRGCVLTVHSSSYLLRPLHLSTCTMITILYKRIFCTSRCALFTPWWGTFACLLLHTSLFHTEYDRSLHRALCSLRVHHSSSDTHKNFSSGRDKT